MTFKILVGVLLVFSLLLSSCYPELSVQQYGKLREDLDALDIERHELRVKVATLEAEVGALETELASMKAKNPSTQAYIEFLYKMVSTQSSAKILEGEFDVGALITARDGLTIAAEEMGDSEIIYFLGLMDTENESQSVSAYYKIIEHCVKQIKQNLE
ncbi:hypothetical protein ACFLVC_01715 [Chloroflexota bacterium]